MAVSKLESLPNEILVNIFEKYINGIDIINAFAYQQNQRFDALIRQCQRYYFDFVNCRKDCFQFCMGLLPAYMEKIEELVLAEHNTPGQIHAFLSLYPSFEGFKRLRRLCIHFNAESVDPETVQTAMLSLSSTSIDTVIFATINADKTSIRNNIFDSILRLQTLKRLCIMNDSVYGRWDLLTNNTSKVQYLTNLGMSCEFQHLQSLFQSIPHLKYLNVRLISRAFYGYYFKQYSENDKIISMPTLHTLILSFTENDSTNFASLACSLKAMPALRRLDIKAHRLLLDANAWEALLQTSLPLLTHFRLKTTASDMSEADLEQTLASFETPFWINKKNFYLIITKHKHQGWNKFGIYKLLVDDQDEFSGPLARWWIAPKRARLDDIPTNDIIALGVSSEIISFSQYYHFNNVKHLVIYDLDEKLLQWILTYTNYSQIKYLDIAFEHHEFETIASLLSRVSNIISLRIEYKLILGDRNPYSGKLNSLKYLDISTDQHRFDSADMLKISQLFPNIEHLVINTHMLANVPLLGTYLPHLCSVSFELTDFRFPINDDDYTQRLWDDQLRQEVQFLFQRDKTRLTIWIDQAALKESYWQTFSSNPSGSNINSMVTTSRKRGFPFAD